MNLLKNAVVVFVALLATPNLEAQSKDRLTIKLQLNQPSFYVRKAFISAKYEGSCELGVKSTIMMIAEPVEFWDGYNFEVLERDVPLTAGLDCVYDLISVLVEFGGDTSKKAIIQLVGNRDQRTLPVAQESNPLRVGRVDGSTEILVLSGDTLQSNELSIGVNQIDDYPNGILLIY